MMNTDSEAQGARSQVVGKAALLIVVVGATGIGLLAERQRRFEAAHTMTLAHREADALEREIRKLRAEIADRLTPTQINARIDEQRSPEQVEGERLRPILWTVNAEQGASE